MLIGDLFEKNVTRAIPPVVYFHEQEPAELKREVDEYIITGGYPKGDPRATEEGIHEQFVRLLTNVHAELKKEGGTELPACWISGFYGSGKSSFAKLLGLALDGRVLPDQTPLSEALLSQDHSPDAVAFSLAWHNLVDGIRPMAVVFDVGSKAREGEHIHAVVVRQVQRRLGYSATSNLVAEYELKLELDGLYSAFLDKVQEVHNKPWGELKDSQLAEDYFSAAMHALQPDLYVDPMSWVDSRTGSAYESKRSADEAAVAVQAMIRQRCPACTLFVVVDEVSQYVHDDDDRMLALQSFVSAIGARMKGKAWLLATGQQKLEEGNAVGAAILKLKDRFPASLRVHLGVANIRDVVHKRLLRKKKIMEADLKDLFQRYRSELALYAYGGESICETDFVEVYPLLPGHVGLLLDITTGLRTRSTRTQGDSHAIRGLLQLLGDLFREKGLAQYEVGRLISIDLIYDVLHSALDADVQMTLARAFEFCSQRESSIMARVVKAVAMLELVQNHQKTSDELIARCLYEQLGQGNLLPQVQEALDALKGESLLSYSEKSGYRIESSAGQEWQRERDQYTPGTDQLSAKVQETLAWLLGDVDRPSLQSMSLPWLALYSDSVGARDVHIKDERKYTVVTVDFQFVKNENADVWVPRSDSFNYKDRIVWVAGDLDGPRYAAMKLVRSERMIDRYGPRQSSLSDDKQRLLIEERNRFDAAKKELADALKAAFMAGAFYFRGRQTQPRDLGASFAGALSAFGNRVASELYPHPTTFSVTEKDILYLIDNKELSAPPPVFGEDRLGILSLDAGRYEVSCKGQVPTDVLAYVRENPGVTGSTLLQHFGSPPHGTPPDVLRAVVIGLLRGGKIRVQIQGVSGDLTSVRDEGVRELMKETGLRKATLAENKNQTVTPRTRNAICALFKDTLQTDVGRNDDAIADAVAAKFPAIRERVTEVGERFRLLPKDIAYPEALTKLERALEACRRDRKVEPTVLAVYRARDALRDGLILLRRMETDLTDRTVDLLRQAEDTWKHLWPGLQALGATDEAQAAAKTIEAHLKSDRPWEDVAELAGPMDLLRGEYRARRKALLDAHEAEVDRAVERIKRREGFEKLNPDQRHQVLRHLQQGANASTDEKAIAPPIEALEAMLKQRREAAEVKATDSLDEILIGIGERPTVVVELHLPDREIKNEADLERWLSELRNRVLHELAAHNKVRLK